MFLHVGVWIFYIQYYFLFKGREEGAVIEDWEDPDLSMYKSTDRYGFMQ